MNTLWVLLSLAVFSVSYCNAKPHLIHPKKHHVHCFSQQELMESSDKVVEKFVGHKMEWKWYNSVKMVEHLEKAQRRRKRTPQAGCPNFETIAKGQSLSERSISPWNYRVDVDENRYPQKLAFAQCLCNHCISVTTGKETKSLNSAPVTTNMLVLRKDTCPGDASKYTFKMEYLSIPVACTCVVPKYI